MLTTASATYHELTHAVACQLRIRTAPVFAEGLAVAFDNEPVTSSTDDLFTLLGATDGTIYGHGGHFTRWLLEREGGLPLAELVVASQAKSLDSGIVAEAIEQVYKTTFKAIESEYLATRPMAWAPLHQCADIPHVEADANGVWRYESTFDCENENTRGPYDGPYTPFRLGMVQSFTFDLAAEQNLTFDINGSFSLREINLTRCAEDAYTQEDVETEFRSSVIFQAPNNETSCPLSPGTWRVDVIASHGPPSSASIEFRVLDLAKYPWCP